MMVSEIKLLHRMKLKLTFDLVDDDLQILRNRLPPDSTPSATIHLHLPRAHAHFAPSPGPPAYTSASSAIKSKANAKASKSDFSQGRSASKSASKPKPVVKTLSIPNGESTSAGSIKVAGSEGWELGPVRGVPRIPENAQAGAGTSAPIGTLVQAPPTAASTLEKGKAMSMMSGKSKRSKWGDDDAEPTSEVIKREWIDVSSPR